MAEIGKPGAPGFPRLPLGPQKPQARPATGQPRRPAPGRTQRSPGQGAALEGQTDSLERDSNAHDAPDHPPQARPLPPLAGVPAPDRNQGRGSARPQGAVPSLLTAAISERAASHATRLARARTESYLKAAQGAPATPVSAALTAMASLFAQAPEGLSREQGTQLVTLMVQAQVTHDVLLHRAVVASGAMPTHGLAEPVRDPSQRAQQSVQAMEHHLAAVAHEAALGAEEARKKTAPGAVSPTDDRRRTEAAGQRGESRINEARALVEQRRMAARRQESALRPGLMSASERQADIARARAAARGKTADAEETVARDDGKGPSKV